MTIRIAKNAKKSEIDKAIKKLASVSSTKKSFKADKYNGKLVRGIDGVEYQRLLRDEWN
jgi:hypothetical protein